MNTNKKTLMLTISKYILIAMALLLLGLSALALSDVISLNSRLEAEAAATPTATPFMQSVMAVTPNPDIPLSPIVLMFKLGAKGDNVIAIQERLTQLGYYTGEIDGQFGPATHDAVIAFQQQHNLDADGIVGPATNDLMQSSSAQVAIPSLPPPQEATDKPAES